MANLLHCMDKEEVIHGGCHLCYPAFFSTHDWYSFLRLNNYSYSVPMFVGPFRFSYNVDIKHWHYDMVAEPNTIYYRYVSMGLQVTYREMRRRVYLGYDCWILRFVRDPDRCKLL